MEPRSLPPITPGIPAITKSETPNFLDAIVNRMARYSSQIPINGKIKTNNAAGVCFRIEGTKIKTGVEMRFHNRATIHAPIAYPLVPLGICPAAQSSRHFQGSSGCSAGFCLSSLRTNANLGNSVLPPPASPSSHLEELLQKPLLKPDL